MANAANAGMGALGGAASGAALGSAIVPGIGTAIGGIVGGLGGLLSGLFGGGSDTSPQLPPITDPVTGAQIQQSQGGVQGGLDQQQAFVNALNAQNGIQNQSNVYGQLQGVANGTGPNPAQAMLNQATGANVANQAALMAGQRGAGANTGLIARQAAQQGGALQQAAAGQGATLQANQSLNALGAAGNLATQQVGQQANAIGNQNQFAQNNQGQLLGAQGQYNTNLTGGQGSVNTTNQTAAQRAANQFGGLLNGAGAAATAFGGKGATLSTASAPGTTGSLAPNGAPNLGVDTTFATPTFLNYAAGGEVPGPSSFVGRHLKGQPQAYAKGGEVNALVSPGERYLPPAEVKKVADGKKSPMKAGEKIPGKPKVGGAKNDYANDTVSKKLKEGGIVLPRSVTQSKDPASAAHAFVSAIMARNKGLK